MTREAYFQNEYVGLVDYQVLKHHLFKIIGYRCYFCDIEYDVDELEGHHPNHDGHLDRERFKTAVSMYRYYVKHPKEALEHLAPICKLCHTEYHRG